MPDIILHHFDMSPFAEKIRLALGLKNLAWCSVQIPMVMPKPKLTALTGGYRKTPVMQIGADIYCDTQCIARELEARYPSPSLFPKHSSGLAMAMSHWSDGAFFQPGSGLALGTNTALPQDIMQDRQAFFDYLDFSTLAAQLPHLYSQFSAQLNVLQQMLEDNRHYLLGDEPGWVDILGYFPVWMARGNIAGAAELLEQFPAIAPWEARVHDIGHGRRSELEADQALEIAAASAADTRVEIAIGSYPNLEAGVEVVVTPADYGAVPVCGSLLRLTHTEISIRRLDPIAGELAVHFPRVGYRVEAVS